MTITDSIYKAKVPLNLNLMMTSTSLNILQIEMLLEF